MKENILIIISFRNFRDEEYFIPKEIFESKGCNVKTASNKKGVAIGAEGGEVEIDFLIQDINIADFDAIVFIGGPGCLKNLNNNISYNVIKETLFQKKFLAAICISPVILAKSGQLAGKKATVWNSPIDRSAIRIFKENGVIFKDEQVVQDDKIITGNGPEAATEFGNKIVESLRS